MADIERRDRWIEIVIILAFTIAAACTRLYGIGDFPLYDDEVTSYMKALRGDINPKFPATDALIYLFFKSIGTSIFVLRLPLALMGVAGIPVVYWTVRRIFGRYAGLSAGLILLFSYYHLDHSQLTRYYTGLFCFGALCLYHFLIYFETGRRAALIWAALNGVLGALFHPTFLVLPMSICCFALIVLVYKPLRQQKHCLHAALLVLVISVGSVLAVAPFWVPLALGWWQKSKTIAGGWGYSYFRLGMQIMKYFSLPLCCAAGIGLVLMILQDRLRGLYVGCIMIVPMLLTVGSSGFMDVRPDYIFAAFPSFFIAAAYMIVHIREKSEKGLFLSMALLVSLIAFMAPEFISNYTGKRSLDVRKAVKYVDDAFEEGDKILSFMKGFNFYMEGKHETEPYVGAWYHSGWDRRLAKYMDDPSRLWIILLESRDGVNPGLKKWLHTNARLKMEIFEKRFDYTFRSIRVYLKE
jgi:hypothetical protein